MITRSAMKAARKRALSLLKKAGVELPKSEKDAIEVAELGLGEFDRQGLALIVWENNDRYCGKELILLPGQTCPEHRHPPVGNDPGKRETFLVRYGVVYLYVEGAPAKKIKARLPKGSEAHYTIRHEVVLKPGERYTIAPNTLHWFQAGPKGAVVTEFSSTSRDEFDIFTDPRIKRVPEVVDEPKPSKKKGGKRAARKSGNQAK
jgi:D-lyxose ketol-isomerase